jgi:hydrogenase nickel incorporation protein HypA/HybF
VHELALAESIVHLALGHAAGRRVTGVGVKVGALRQVVPDSLSFSFELVVQGTAAEGAFLEIEGVEAAGRCARCGVESRISAFPLRCEGCGELGLEVVRGEELRVEWVEVEEDADGVSALAP